jgi:Domain of unknown function DUF1828
LSVRLCEQLVSEYVRTLGEQFACGTSDGSVWLVSPYTFSDGDLIGISVLPVHDGWLRVSDLGETLRHLANYDFDPLATPKGQYVIAEILKQHHVDLDRGMITRIASSEEVGQAIQDVLTASFKTAQLIFLAQHYRPATSNQDEEEATFLASPSPSQRASAAPTKFDEEVAAFLVSRQFKFRPTVDEIGRSGKKYTVDFVIQGRTRLGLLKTLSPASPSGVYVSVNATLRLWLDLPANGHRNLTLLNDRQISWKPADVNILSQGSEVFFWSQQGDRFLEVLTEI